LGINWLQIFQSLLLNLIIEKHKTIAGNNVFKKNLLQLNIK